MAFFRVDAPNGVTEGGNVSHFAFFGQALKVEWSSPGKQTLKTMKIGPWVARKRKAFWVARFAVAVANCNASMISRSQHITDWA